MCFIQSGNTTYVISPNLSPEEQKQLGEGLATLVLFLSIIFIGILVLAPIWSPFYFIENLFDNFVKQISYDGWIIDPITRFILLSIGFILFSPICFFVIIPLYVGIINFCIYLFKQVKNLILGFFRQPIIPSQKQQKFLIKTKVLIVLWILSLLVLPLLAFQTQIGLQYFLGTLTRSYAENNRFYQFVQNPFDQIELLGLEKKYSLHLKPEERLIWLRTREFGGSPGSNVNSIGIHTFNTNLGLRSGIILVYDELEKLENKYHIKFSVDEKLSIIDLAAETIYKIHKTDIIHNFPRDRNDIEGIPDSEVLNFLEYSFISTIAVKKYPVWNFSRNHALELTKLWKHNLSNEQKKISYELYCNQVVNSIYIAYRQESGYLPSQDDSRMINSEAKNPKGDSDFNDCRKFLLNKGYRFNNDSKFHYFYEP